MIPSFDIFTIVCVFLLVPIHVRVFYFECLRGLPSVMTKLKLHLAKI